MVTHQDFIPIILAHKQQLTPSTRLAFQSLKGHHANTCGPMLLVYLRDMLLCLNVHVQDLTIIKVGFPHLLESTITAKLDSIVVCCPYETAWGDPLWDGNGCFALNNACCNRYGWFYRHVQESSKYVEVRVCGYYVGYDRSDVALDQLEIWVM